MKKLFLLAGLLASITSFAQVQTWIKPWAIPISVLDNFEIQRPVYNYVLLGNAFSDHERAIEELQNLPKGSVKISPEFIEYRFGRIAIYRETPYIEDLQTPYELNDEVKLAQAKSAKRELTKEDLKGPNWINLIQAIDKEEVNCLSISRVDGKTQGCGDPWQDGLQEEELVCFKGKTYIKCHVECIEKIYNRKLELTEGSCNEV
jgi:hypothetical protein